MTTASDRTPRLHLVATLTIWASEELAPNEKIVWYHTWLLDNAPSDGCYMSSRSMGERLGLSPKTIEETRSRLRGMELLDSFDRPGTVQPGWVAKIPASLVPQSRDIQKAIREVQTLRENLDRRIVGYRAGLARKRTEDRPDIGRKTIPRGSGGRFRPQPEDSSVSARSARDGEGVGGGAPTSASETIERSLPPAVTEHLRQMGDGSHEPKSENEQVREPTREERLRMAIADEEAAEEVRRQGWEKIRSAKQRRTGT